VTAVVASGSTPRAGRRPADLRRYSRWLAVLLLPIGPAAIAVLRFVLPYSTVDAPAEVTAKVIGHPGTMSLVLWLGFVGILTLVPGVLAVGRLTRRSAPRLTAAALVLAVPGYLVLAWLVSSDLLLWAGATVRLDAATLTRLFEATHPSVDVGAGVFVLGHVVGTVLLGLAMWRSRAVPRWAAVLTMLSQPLHFVAAVVVASPALDLVAWGMNAVGFAAAAVVIATLPDDEWDLPPAEPA